MPGRRRRRNDRFAINSGSKAYFETDVNFRWQKSIIFHLNILFVKKSEFQAKLYVARGIMINAWSALGCMSHLQGQIRFLWEGTIFRFLSEATTAPSLAWAHTTQVLNVETFQSCPICSLQTYHLPIPTLGRGWRSISWMTGLIISSGEVGDGGGGERVRDGGDGAWPHLAISTWPFR